MKVVVLLVAALAMVSAEWIEIDWSQVKPIEQFDHYWARLPTELQLLRNAIPNRRITNGQEAVPGQFPFQIALLSTFLSGTGLCGGSVLNNNFILTAAHCVHNASGGTAIMGAHNRFNDEPSQQRIAFTTAGINIHAGYNPTTIRNDIATVRLNSPMTFTVRVQPLRIPTHADERTFGGWLGTVSGFGRTSDTSQDTSPVIMFTSNPIKGNGACLLRWGNNHDLIQDQNICMTGEDGHSPCNGDSGGPLTVRDAGLPLQVGIVSFGSAAGCTIEMPSVFVRVTYFLSWIEQHSG